MKLAHDHWFTFDKLQHIGKGMLTYALLHIAFPWVPNFYPFVVAVIFASGYEVYDANRGVGYSFKDLMADTVGAGLLWKLWAWRMP